MKSKSKQQIPVVVLLMPKWLIRSGKILQKISLSLTVKFAIWLFTKTLRYPLPKRAIKMHNQSNKQLLSLADYPEKIMVYRYGNGEKKILLVHGWAGTGTQLSKIAEKLIALGYQIISFDAPGHGSAPGKSSMLLHFVSAIQQLEQIHGSFEFAIGHSLGGMALLRAARQGLGIKKLVIIGTANSITTIINNFVKHMQLLPAVAKGMKTYFDHTFGNDINQYSGAVSASFVTIPTLVIHDEDDVDVSITAAHEIHRELLDGELFLTKGLGHRKILGKKEVIDKISNFIQKEKQIAL